MERACPYVGSKSRRAVKKGSGRLASLHMVFRRSLSAGCWPVPPETMTRPFLLVRPDSSLMRRAASLRGSRWASSHALSTVSFFKMTSQLFLLFSVMTNKVSWLPTPGPNSTFFWLKNSRISCLRLGVMEILCCCSSTSSHRRPMLCSHCSEPPPAPNQMGLLHGYSKKGASVLTYQKADRLCRSFSRHLCL